MDTVETLHIILLVHHNILFNMRKYIYIFRLKRYDSMFYPKSNNKNLHLKSEGSDRVITTSLKIVMNLLYYETGIYDHYWYLSIVTLRYPKSVLLLHFFR